MNHAEYCLFDTALGPCGIAWRAGKGAEIILLRLPEATAKLTESAIIGLSGASLSKKPPRRIAQAIAKITRHLAGKCQDFSEIRLDFSESGTFAKRVYEVARKIPIGQTRSYGELAAAAGKPGAARAVGQALGKNPIAIVIPCHRILAAGGKPGGFSAHGGKLTKAKLLALEGAADSSRNGSNGHKIAKPRPHATIKSPRSFRRSAELLKSLDPKLAHCLSQPIEMRFKPGHSPYESLCEAVVYQQLTGRAAATILGRVKAIKGGSMIPPPKVLLKIPDDDLRAAGLSRAKTIALKDIAAKAIDGTVPTAEEIVFLNDEEIIKRLTTIRGIGRWTVEMLLIFNLGRADIFPVDDYALRKIYADIHGLKEMPKPRELAALTEIWRPHRTAASLYLWNYIRAKSAEAKGK